MADQKALSASDAQETRVTLGLLTAVSADSLVTQRTLSNELGIALGLANAYLKRCVRKGYIKISQIRPNRFAYYLTPRGFSEKSRLTASYLSQSFLLFREARIQYRQLLEKCALRGWRRIALYGAGDLGEIAKICAVDQQFEIVCIISPWTDAESDFPIFDALVKIPDIDAILISNLEDPQAAYDDAIAHIAVERVLYPAILNISENHTVMTGADR
jgi:hypothetical protein